MILYKKTYCKDTAVERNLLMETVYPRLKEYCREQHGLEFQVVDMRWGVRDESTDDHKTAELCMQEIDNCQRLSLGPNFVVSGGDLRAKVTSSNGSIITFFNEFF